MLHAVLFDWDGVVVDSSAHHERSWEILAGRHGLSLPPDHFKRGFGKKNNVIIPDLGWAAEAREVDAIAHEKEEIYRELVRLHGIEPLPGVRELLAELYAAKMPTAIASSTERANLDLLLDIMDLRRFFAAIVSGDDVTHGKPDPSVFLMAAKSLGAHPGGCVVIEDALVGIEAAKRAGMYVLAVATTEPVAALQAADKAVETLEGFTVEQLHEMAGEKKSLFNHLHSGRIGGKVSHGQFDCDFSPA